MSRVARMPVKVPSGVEVKINGQELAIKGPKGTMHREIHPMVALTMNDGAIQFATNGKAGYSRSGSGQRLLKSIAGTTRALVNNMVTGVSKGFERKLTLIGVGYRAAIKGKILNLTIGFSHPVDFPVPEGVVIETPSQTEVIIRGVDKQLVGYVAAKIRDFRPPEPYKGKGIRYSDEVVIKKETKKK